MQIITIDYEPSTKRGGQERSLFDVIKGFRLEGHEVILGYCIEGNLISKYHEIGVKTIQIDGINIYHKLSIKEWTFFFRSIKAIRNAGIKKDATIYLNQIMDLPLGVGLKFMTKATRLICHLRLPPLGKPFSQRFDQISLCNKFVNKYVVATTKMFEAHSRHGISVKKTAIIPNGFWFDDMVIPEHQAPNNPIWITYLGRIDENKGIHVAIDVLSRIAKKGYDFVFHIGGIPMNETQIEYKKRLERDIVNNNLTSKIKFIGHIENPIDHLAKYDLSVFTSILDESFGRVLVESIIAGTPVIASINGSTTEILNDTNKDWIYSNQKEFETKLTLFFDGMNYDIQAKREYMLSHYNLKNIVTSIIQ